MSEELYLDLVSKTIISMLSKEISAHVGSQIGVQVNELLSTALPGLISDKLSAQTTKLEARIMELEGALKPLIGDVLGDRIKDISAKIDASFEELGGKMSGVVDSTAKLAGQSGQDMAKKIMDGIGKHTDEALLKTSGAFSKDLSAINDTLLNNFGQQNKLIDNALGQRIKDISAKIDTSFAQIGEKMSGVADSTAKLADQSGQDIAKQVIDGLGKQTDEVFLKTSGAIRNDLSAINDTLLKNFGEQNKLIDNALGQRIKDISEKIDASFADIAGKMSGIVDSTAKLAGQSNLEVIKQVAAGLENQIQDVFKTSGAIKKELSTLNETFLHNFERQNKPVDDTLGQRIQDISTKMDASLADIGVKIAGIVDSTARLTGQSNLDMVQKVTESLSRQTEETIKTSNAFKKDLSTLNESLLKNFGGRIEGIYASMDRASNDLAAIKQSLESREKEEGEMIKGVFYSMKKLTGDFGKEREETISYNKQFLKTMGDMKEHIDDLLGLKEAMQYGAKEQNKLLSDTIGDIIKTLEKQLPFFNGKLETTLSAIDAKMSEFQQKTQTHIDNANTGIMTFVDENVRNSFKDLCSGFNSLKGDIAGLKQMLDGSSSEQNNMLQGVFLSVKKMLGIMTKERDSNEKVANELANALDNLYSQIRRLESEKDELDVELLRFAGDDYFKSKFKALENELAKARDVAEKYRSEKTELEQKYLTIQNEWDQSRRIDTDGE